MTTRLSVNINKVALVRNGRGGNVPDVIQFARDCEEYGADGITVHPRPDERHIRYNDVRLLKQVVTTELNVEGYPNAGFLDLVNEVIPDQVTLVPDAPDVLTSDQGWDIASHKSMLKEVISALQEKGMRVSLFVDAELRRMEEAAEVGADRIELYTGPFAEAYANGNLDIAAQHAVCAIEAVKLGLGVNAGHDLSLENLKYYAKTVPELLEVSIGHALISDSLYYGIQNVISLYKSNLN